MKELTEDKSGGTARAGQSSAVTDVDRRRPGVEPPAAGEPMLELLNGFIRELREAGLPVSLTENLDAMQAVKHIPLEDREAFKYALAATLVKNNAHWRAFETVFEVYFSLRGKEYDLRRRRGRLSRPTTTTAPTRQAGEGQSGRAGAGGEAMTPEELAEMLYQGADGGRRRPDAGASPARR